MGEKRLVPELRFPEFDDFLTQKKYGDIYSFYTTNSFSRDKLNYEKGDVYNIHYGDIHTKFSTGFDIVKENIPFINKEIDLLKINKECYCQEGDLVVADASEDYNDIGKTIELLNLNNKKVLAGLHTFLARPNKDNMATGFAGYLLQTWKVRKQIMIISQGTKVLSLSTGRLSKIKLDIPSSKEQQKIATFLTSVDQRLQLLEKKKAKLEAYKKGVMQQIFSQEVRFKDDRGKDFPEWEEKKLEVVCEKKSSNISANSLPEESGEFKIYGATGFLRYVDFFREEAPYISIVKDGAGVGRILLCDAKSSVLGTLDILKPKGDNDINFLYSLLSNIRFDKYVTGSTIPHIYFKDYSKEKMLVPSLPEQQKIATFLSSIDKNIEQITQQIEKSKSFKKGLLQKMFV